MAERTILIPVWQVGSDILFLIKEGDKVANETKSWKWHIRAKQAEDVVLILAIWQKYTPYVQEVSDENKTRRFELIKGKVVEIERKVV